MMAKHNGFGQTEIPNMNLNELAILGFPCSCALHARKVRYLYP